LNEALTCRRIGCCGFSLGEGESLDFVSIGPLVEDVGEKAGRSLDTGVLNNFVKDSSRWTHKRAGEHFFFTAWRLSYYSYAAEW
jgi:hypothetical protein